MAPPTISSPLTYSNPEDEMEYEEAKHKTTPFGKAVETLFQTSLFNFSLAMMLIALFPMFRKS